MKQLLVQGDNRSNEIVGRVFQAAGVSLLLLSFASLSGAQSQTPAAQPPAAKQSAPTEQKDSTTKASRAAKSKRVITNEDLEPHSAPGSQPDRIVTGEGGSLLNCDTACEQQARDLLGYDSDYEAEWRMQVVRARRDLIADGEWRGLLSQSTDQVKRYCNFLAQESQQTAPSGNSFNAQVERARNAQYFESMGITLRQGLEATVNRMENRMKEVGALSPARAAMMNVEANRVFNRTCAQPPQR